MYRDFLVNDFKSPAFQRAFREYFAEIGLEARDWDALFEEMEHDENGENLMFVRCSETGRIIGFIEFTVMNMGSWFFRVQLGFVREFWVAREYRNNGHGTELLALVEEYFRERDIGYVVLTTYTAERFYLKRGYEKNLCFWARNEDPVYLK
ncbi:MAG: GNAT family N-acetyltransferase, partial [Lachnospiraceae bacterium]|nr:GNAT family N-acetyltransferase [Lachnospiraceae bacterium]